MEENQFKQLKSTIVTFGILILIVLIAIAVLTYLNYDQIEEINFRQFMDNV